MAAETGPARVALLLGLGLLGAVLTFASLVPELGWPPRIGIFAPRQGLSRDDRRQLDAVRKLGGEAHFMERTSPFLGLFGGRDLLHFSFSGTAFDDESLARFVKDHGNRVWGLDLRNTGITDAGLRHLAGLRHVRLLVLGNEDFGQYPRTTHTLNSITDAGLVHLKGLTSLQSLNLGGLPITDAGLDAIKDLPDLGGLYLDRTQVRGPGLGLLKSLAGLAVIYLDRSAVTDEGLVHLKGANNLQLLWLAGVPLTPRGWSR